MVNDLTYAKAHQYLSGAQRCNQAIPKTKEIAIQKLHLIVKEYAILTNFIVANRSHHDRKATIHLIENINTKSVFTDRAYATNKILSYLNKQNIKPIIPPKSNRIYQRDYKCFKEKKQ